MKTCLNVSINFIEPSPRNNHVLERPTNCDARGSILCATKLWRHSKWRWKDERPADRTKKHGSAFACVHRTPTRSQVAQEIRKRSSFVKRNEILGVKELCFVHICCTNYIFSYCSLVCLARLMRQFTSCVGYY